MNKEQKKFKKVIKKRRKRKGWARVGRSVKRKKIQGKKANTINIFAPAKYYCRWAPSLGGLEARHEEAWGTHDYIVSDTPNKKYQPTVFFGLYDLRDYIALWRHKGKAWILWAGSDLENLIHGFAFNDGKLKLLSKSFKGFFANRILKVIKRADNYVEDLDEQEKLKSLGIDSKIAPSFLGKVEDFPVSYKWRERPQVYISGNPGRQKEYGFEFIEWLADRVSQCDFHIYGADWSSNRFNIICHGRIPKEQFNKEIRDYQSGLRLNYNDGFSEITAKSVLMGQYPITRLAYPEIAQFKDNEHLIFILKSLAYQRSPNLKSRNYYLKNLNKYPWNRNK